METRPTLVEPIGDAVVEVLFSAVVGHLDGSRERVELEIQVVVVDERLQQNKHTHACIGVNSYWAQGLKPPPTFMIMGLAYMTSPPTFVT